MARDLLITIVQDLRSPLKIYFETLSNPRRGFRVIGSKSPIYPVILRQTTEFTERTEQKNVSWPLTIPVIFRELRGSPLPLIPRPSP